MNGIRQATLSGLKWGTAIQLGQNLLGILATLALARLLGKDDFGLVALVTAILALLATLVDLGFGAALIQKREVGAPEISTAFYSTLLLGLALTAAAIAFAPLLAHFWEKPALVPVLMVSSSLLTIRAFASVPTALYERELQLRAIAGLTLGANLVGSIVKIALAWGGAGVWSLVFGEIIIQGLISLSLWMRLRDRISFALVSRERFVSLFRFGRSITLTNLLNNLSRNVDVLVVGKLLPAGLLGIYTVSLGITNILSNSCTAIIQRIAFPAFARVQDDPQRLRKGYLEALQYSAALIVAPTLGLGLVAAEFVEVVLSNKWTEGIPVIRILTVYAAVNALGGPLWGQVLKATGHVSLLLRMTVLRVVALPVAIVIGSFWGLLGICYGIVAYAVIFRLVYQHMVNRYIHIRMKDFFAAVAPALLASAVMTGCVIAVSAALEPLPLPVVVLLIIKVAVGAAAYIAALLMVGRPLALGLWHILASTVPGLGRSGRHRPW